MPALLQSPYNIYGFSVEDAHVNAIQPKTIGLVLQGGGALGAYELGVIEYILEAGLRPEIVSGVSIGAVNATLFCGARTANPLQTMTGMGGVDHVRYSVHAA